MTHEQPENKKRIDNTIEQRLAEASEAYGEITGEELKGWRHLARLWLRNVATADPVIQQTAYTILGLIVLTILKTTTAAYLCATVTGALGIVALALSRRGTHGTTARRRRKNPPQSRPSRQGSRANGAAP